MKIAIGSTRKAKLAAMHGALASIAAVVPAWRDAEVIGVAVNTDAPAMPLSDEELIHGARARAAAVRVVFAEQGSSVDYCIGMEGGFHTLRIDKIERTFLRGWVCATDGARESFGSTGSIIVPARLARRVIAEGLELGALIDEVAQEHDVRSRQGAWGVFSLDLVTRAASFETAVIAALAPFFNSEIYSTHSL